jgi:putative copper export protein
VYLSFSVFHVCVCWALLATAKAGHGAAPDGGGCGGVKVQAFGSCLHPPSAAPDASVFLSSVSLCYVCIHLMV